MEEWLKHQPLLSVTERRWVVENCKTLRDVWDKGSPEMVIYVAGLPGMMGNCGGEPYTVVVDEADTLDIGVIEETNGLLSGAIYIGY